MKGYLLFCVLVLSSYSWAQSLSDAERLFNQFEYASAAQAYEHVGKTKKLDIESRKKLAYSYYTIGDYEKCYPVVDSMIDIQDIEPFFLYMHGRVAIERGMYDESKASLERYRSKDDEFNVDMLILSCDSLKIWKANDSVKFDGDTSNISKADINGGSYKSGYFVFREAGVDSVGVELNTSLVDKGELILARPYLVNNELQQINISLPLEFKLAAVTSVASFSGTDQFLITLTQPSHKDEIFHAPHLYLATYDNTGSFTNIAPWVFSGIEDTSSCAYATINSKGDRLVFAKNGSATRGSDLYVSALINEVWSKPESIEFLNTEYDEIAPMFSGDSILTFASNGRPGYGSLDIYTTSYDGNNFGNIQHPKSPINSFHDDFNYTWVNDSMALLTSNRYSGKGDDDIYRISVPKVTPPVVDTTGNALDDFLATWIDKKILFDYDKYSIKDQKTIEMIADDLKKFEGLKIIIEGHTDIRGIEIYNIELGKQRAVTVRDEFLKLGVHGDNLLIISKGEEEALVDCTKGCTEEQHQENRAVIIKIQKN